MSYIVGGNIEATDYNQFVFQAKRLVGDIYSGAVTEDNGLSIGYGRPNNLSEVAVGEVVTDEKWAELIDTIKAIGVHQGTATTPPMPSVVPASGDIVEVYDSPITFQILLDTVYGNRLNVAAGQYVDVNGPASSYSQQWTDLAEFTVDVDFGSWDSLRYFFNTGGSIFVNASYTQGATPTPAEIQMQAVLENMSPLKISARKTEQDQGLNQSPNGQDFGVYNLPPGYPEFSTLYLQSFNGGAFENQGIRVEARIKNQPGTDGIVTLRFSAIDTNGDSKTGTLTVEIDHRKSSGVIPYTGTVTVSGQTWYAINTPAPVITSVTPASGPERGDTSVTIRGINFINIATVIFGEQECLGFSVINDTTIQAITPPGAVGSSVSVIVATETDISNDNVKYSYVSSGSTTLPIIATGGTIEDRLVGWRCYRYHTFTASGTFNVLSRGTYSNTVEYLMISGGGGGGNNYGGAGAGGGGGGGTRFRSSSEVFVQPYSVGVGAGGGAYQSGGSTSFMGHIIPGGGHGGQYAWVPAGSGSSGGGAGQGGAQYKSPHTRVDYGAGPVAGGWGNGGGSSIMYAGMAVAGGGGGGGIAGGGGDSKIVAIRTKKGSPDYYWYAYINGGDGGAGTTNGFLGYEISICGGGGGAGSNRSSTAQIYGWDPEYWYFTAPTGEAGNPGGATVNGSFVRSGGRGAVWGYSAPEAGIPNRGGGGGGGNGPFVGATGGSGLVSVRYLKCDLPLYDFDRGFVAARSLPNRLDSATSTVLRDGKILVAGGLINGTTVTADVVAYNPYTNAWTTLASLPSPRYDASAETLPDNRVMVWGGAAAATISDTSIYTPSTNSWAAGPAYPIAAYEMAHCKLANGDIFSVGGWLTAGAAATSLAYIYRVSTNSWQQVASCPEAFTEGAASLMQDGRVIVCFSNRTYFYNPTANTWAAGPAFPVVNSRFGMITTPDGNVGAYGGTGSGARVFVYNPCCNAWGQAAQSMPLFLTEHQVQISNNGAEVFIIGGLEPTYGSVQNVYRQVLRDVPAWTPMVATGGNVEDYTTPEGVTYRTHTFTNTGNSIFSVQSLGSSDGKIDYLLVGGGGGAGSRGGGGGGGGGVTTGIAYVTVQNYTVTVGAGGAGAPAAPNVRGSRGGNSTFNGVSAIGGGGGGSYVSRGNTGLSGLSGGSGGGGGAGDGGNDGADPQYFAIAGAAGARTLNQGFVGGGGIPGVYTDSGGGGGGAGGAGAAPTAYNAPLPNRNKPGNGGAGRSIQLKTLSPIAYGGGGGGSGLVGDPTATGGTGGGGNSFANGVNGLGGGGGGGYYFSGTGYTAGGNGGSGTVIIRYQITP